MKEWVLVLMQLRETNLENSGHWYLMFLVDATVSSYCFHFVPLKNEFMHMFFPKGIPSPAILAHEWLYQVFQITKSWKLFLLTFVMMLPVCLMQIAWISPRDFSFALGSHSINYYKLILLENSVSFCVGK